MSERLYSLLLHLYPRPFRERYAEEMMRVFRDRLRDEGAVRVWLDVLGDAVVSIPRQHIVQEPHRYYPPSAAPLRAANAVMMQAKIVSVIGGAVLGLVIRLLDISGFFMTWPLAALLLVALWITACKKIRASQALKVVRAEASSDAVTVAYAGVAPLTLRRSEVIGLHEFESVGIRIETADPTRDLWVPARAEAYAAVKARLGQWAPVKATPHPLFRALTKLSGYELSFPALLTILYALALLMSMPMTFTGLVGYLMVLISAFVRRDVPMRRKLLVTGSMVILLVRRLW